MPDNHEERVVMKVVTLKDVQNDPMEGAEPIEGYTGPVSRSRQTIINPGDSPNYNWDVADITAVPTPFTRLATGIPWRRLRADCRAQRETRRGRCGLDLGPGQGQALLR